jgi:predicted DNA-binding transcriptional regulator AlpA
MVLMTEKSGAQYLGGEKPLSIKTLQRWRLDGRGPQFIKIGRLVRYSQESLDQYLAGQVRRSTSENSGEAAK